MMMLGSWFSLFSSLSCLSEQAERQIRLTTPSEILLLVISIRKMIQLLQWITLLKFRDLKTKIITLIINGRIKPFVYPIMQWLNLQDFFRLKK
jgi:hypothetical protein